MAAFAPATHKVVTASSANLKDALPVDARVMLASLFSSMGLFQVTVSNTAPSDRDVLWWHADVKQFKRYDAVNGNWYPAVANQIAMHMMRRALLGSVQEINLESADLFYFWDASAAELKKITKDDLSNNIIKDALARLNARRLYISTASGPQTYTLPASPTDKDILLFFDLGGNWQTNNLTIARNGKKIWGATQDLVCDRKDIGVELQYVAADGDWKVSMLFRSAAK